MNRDAKLDDMQWHRLLTLVERVYTRDYLTSGGITKTRNGITRQLDMARAQEAVDFAANYVTNEYRTPAGLWDALFTRLLEDGTLIRQEDGSIRSYKDRKVMQ